MSVQAQFCQPGNYYKLQKNVDLSDFKSRDLGCSYYYDTQHDLAFHMGDASGLLLPTVTSYPHLSPGLSPGCDSLSQESTLGTKLGERLELCALPLLSLDKNELLKER